LRKARIFIDVVPHLPDIGNFHKLLPFVCASFARDDCETVEAVKAQYSHFVVSLQAEQIFDVSRSCGRKVIISCTALTMLIFNAQEIRFTLIEPIFEKRGEYTLSSSSVGIKIHLPSLDGHAGWNCKVLFLV